MMAPLPTAASSPTEAQGLDPADWSAHRALGHQMVDDMVDYLAHLGDRPVWQPLPDEVKASLHAPLPQQPADPARIYADFQQHILPYNTGNVHPRFWGWVQGTGTPLGMLADLLASGMNPNMGIGEHAPTYVEHQVIDWCRELMSFPSTASGLLVNGGTMANLVGLAVARSAMATRWGIDVRVDGVAALGRVRIYASAETHSCVTKSAELLGLGRGSIRLIPVDADYRIRLDLLEAALTEDRAAGIRPLAIVGNCGTVATGATDDLAALRRIADREQCWFHVDGAFGALAWLVPEQRPFLAGLTDADSLAFDLHKWMYMPYAIGCVLVRDSAAHLSTFGYEANYLTRHERGLAAGPTPFSQLGLELSRDFKALKAWFSLREHGVDRYAQAIADNIAQAQYLAQLITAAPELELLAPVPLNIVCFRFCREGLSEEQVNSLNREILMTLHERGIAAPTYTVLQGRYALRCAITNHRSRLADFDALVEAVVKIGRELAG
jgi:aromatic-L-amino-acid/L-tryptophan decarboxylase